MYEGYNPVIKSVDDSKFYDSPSKNLGKCNQSLRFTENIIFSKCVLK